MVLRWSEDPPAGAYGNGSQSHCQLSTAHMKLVEWIAKRVL